MNKNLILGIIFTLLAITGIFFIVQTNSNKAENSENATSKNSTNEQTHRK